MNFASFKILFSIFIGVTSERFHFPNDFLWGAASASYQIEGAWNVDGKLKSIWDTATHKSPSSVVDDSNGDDAAMSYTFYEKDIQALSDVGFKIYRFSISWCRVLKENLEVNQMGLNYYSKIIDALLAKEIKPLVTMYHWDLPQHIQDIDGWTNPKMEIYFKHYADLLFKTYGDRVKDWITFNEPAVFCDQGYSDGSHAPQITTERNMGGFLCSHNMLLSHAAAYNLYKEKYYETQKGRVGICLNTGYMYPANENVTQKTVDKYLEFYFGRYAHPIFSSEGDYPKIMRKTIDEKSKKEGRKSSRLPKFTNEQIKSVKGSADFLALNYYSSNLVTPFSQIPGADFESSDVEIAVSIDTKWKLSSSSWLYQVPEGFRDVLLWIKEHYNNPLIYITENGWSDEGTLNDHDRVEYLNLHLASLSQAIDQGSNVKAYTVWSLIDNFEWMEGYTKRFGIYSINFTDPLRPRIPKLSVQVFKDLLNNNFIDVN